MFNSAEEADKIIKTREFTERQKMSSGDWDAPYMLRKLAYDTNGKMDSEVIITVAQIKMNFIPTTSIREKVFDIKAKPAWEN